MSHVQVEKCLDMWVNCRQTILPIMVTVTILTCPFLIKFEKSWTYKRREAIHDTHTLLFAITKCVICPEDNIEKLHKAHSDSRDIQLKNALNIVPKSTILVQIRCERSRDAHAGDILYHTSCWSTHIIHAGPDFEHGVMDEYCRIEENYHRRYHEGREKWITERWKSKVLTSSRMWSRSTMND